MAVNTTVARNNYNRGKYGWLNLRTASPTGINVGTVLTIGGDLVMTVKQVMAPHSAGATFQCQITGNPRGKGRLIIRSGDTVTG
jgi:hypothetical protein